MWMRYVLSCLDLFCRAYPSWLCHYWFNRIRIPVEPQTLLGLVYTNVWPSVSVRVGRSSDLDCGRSPCHVEWGYGKRRCEKWLCDRDIWERIYFGASRLSKVKTPMDTWKWHDNYNCDKTVFGTSPLSMFIVLSPACVFPMCRLSGDERAAVLSRK